MVWRGHAFPHSTKPDLFLLYDRECCHPLPFPHYFHCYGKEGEGILNAEQLERIADKNGGGLSVELHAVVTLGKHDQHFWGHHHGPLAFKLKQLQLLGHRFSKNHGITLSETWFRLNCQYHILAILKLPSIIIIVISSQTMPLYFLSTSQPSTIFYYAGLYWCHGPPISLPRGAKKTCPY